MALDLYGTTDPNLEEAYRYARLAPHEQIALESRLAEHGVEQGVGKMLSGGLGLPAVESQNREQAGLELRALGQKMTPGTAEFYAAAANILGKYNLVAEAEEMTRRGHALEIGKGELNPALKAQRAKEELLKMKASGANVDAALAALDRQIAALGVKVASSGAVHPDVKLMDARDAAAVAGDTERAAELQKIIDVKKSGVGISAVDQARLDLATKKEDRTQAKQDRKEEQEDAAFASSVQSLIPVLNNDINNASELWAHPGLSVITGSVAGLGARVGAVFSKGAYALLQTVQAQTFLKALRELKAASPRTGATGLGQLTEVEGAKIQNAQAALDPQQPTAQFKRLLGNYIAQLKSSRANILTKLKEIGAEIPAPVPYTPPDAVPAAAPTALTTRQRKFTATPVTE